MQIERILAMDDSDRNTLGMILSNRMEWMNKGEAYVRVCNEDLVADLIAWHNHTVPEKKHCE